VTAGTGTRPDDRDSFGRGVLDALTVVLEDKAKRCNAMAEEHADLRYPHFIDFERDILLRILDTQWKDHLHTMDGLRDGIGLRGYASRDPKLEYQREGYALFEDMNDRIDQQSLDLVYKFVLPEPVMQPAAPPTQRGGGADPRPAARAAAGRARPAAAGGAGGSRPGKVGRNDPCPCGSGKKYKKCCGAG
jgi:preprotein translocase subunit SecA